MIFKKKSLINMKLLFDFKSNITWPNTKNNLRIIYDHIIAILLLTLSTVLFCLQNVY